MKIFHTKITTAFILKNYRSNKAMELHSYAKRRTLKKWTIEQKRKLVEVRIAHDAWFVNKPSSVVPWKNILIAANLDDFNVYFVRKQWSNMLARYKQYKQTRLGNNNIASKTIDAELIKRINQEWEFFEPIHKFMTRKTTNLHSYALTHRSDDYTGEQHEKVEEQVQNPTTEQEQCQKTTNKTPTKLSLNETITISKPKDCAKENIPNNNTTIHIQSNISQDRGIYLFSSDTNEEFQVIDDTTRIISKSKARKLSMAAEEDEHINCVRNTDHDFYSKRSTLGDIADKEIYRPRADDDELQEQQSNYFADASEESQSSTNVVIDLLQINNTTNSTIHLNSTPTDNGNLHDTDIKTENHFEGLEIKAEINEQEFLHDMPSTSTERNFSQSMAKPQAFTKPRLSERDKYYRHKRRFNRRLEKRFDAILQVMGQVVKTGYPNVDITPLVGTVTSMAASMGKVLSSDSEDDNKNDENV